MKRKKYNNTIKTKVALAALKAQDTNSAIASEFCVHTCQVNRWKKQAIDGLPGVFGNNQTKTIQSMENERNRLFQQIVKLQVELNWVKKKTGVSLRSLTWPSAMSIDEKRSCIDPKHKDISVMRQCDLIDLSRSSFYRQQGLQVESDENLHFMQLIDEEYTKYPFFGSRKLRDSLRR